MGRSRTRRIAKWMGLMACAVLMLAQVVGHWWSVERSSARVVIHIGGGFFAVSHLHVPQSPGRFMSLVSSARNSEWTARRTRHRRWWFVSSRSAPVSGISVSYFVFPLWIPILALTIPTVWLWRRDRRRLEGYCRKCEYDLTGNVTGVCSECGTKIPITRSPSA